MLIVDDDDKLREFVRVNLEMEGYTVREAASAREGLAALEEQSPDLVLLDVMMPEMDGWEMLRQIHERHGVGAIPVIVFSGQVEEDQARWRRAARRPSSASPSARRASSSAPKRSFPPESRLKMSASRAMPIFSRCSRSCVAVRCEPPGRQSRPPAADLGRPRSFEEGRLCRPG